MGMSWGHLVMMRMKEDDFHQKLSNHLKGLQLALVPDFRVARHALPRGCSLSGSQSCLMKTVASRLKCGNLPQKNLCRSTYKDHIPCSRVPAGITCFIRETSRKVRFTGEICILSLDQCFFPPKSGESMLCIRGFVWRQNTSTHRLIRYRDFAGSCWFKMTRTRRSGLI
jgi:hypothetical protein